MYLELKMGDPSEDEVAAFRLDIEQRDYVQVLGDAEVRHFIGEEDTKKLATKVNERWGKVRNDKQAQPSKQIYDLIVKPLHDKVVLHGWNPKNHKLCNMFARELAEGTVTRTQLRSAMFVLSRDFKEHDILPGLLAATVRQQARMRIRGQKADADLMQRAAWYLVNVMGASVSSLRQLSLTGGCQTKKPWKFVVPEFLQPKDGPRILLPRSYHSICFSGAAPWKPWAT